MEALQGVTYDDEFKQKLCEIKRKTTTTHLEAWEALQGFKYDDEFEQKLREIKRETMTTHLEALQGVTFDD